MSSNTGASQSPATFDYKEIPFTIERTIANYQSFYKNQANHETFGEEKTMEGTDIRFKMSLLKTTNTKLYNRIHIVNYPGSNIIVTEYSFEVEKEDGQICGRKTYKAVKSFTEKTRKIVLHKVNPRNPTGAAGFLPQQVETGKLIFRLSGIFLHQDNSLSHPKRDITMLFNDAESSDVKIAAGGKIFHVHRCFFPPRSPLFEELFLSGIPGNPEADITDIEPDVFEAFLRFFYTDDIPSSTNTITDLLLYADKHNVDSLKELCEYELLKSMNVENCIEHYFTSESGHAENLRNQSLAFIKGNEVAVKALSAWTSMSEERKTALSTLITGIQNVSI